MSQRKVFTCDRCDEEIKALEHLRIDVSVFQMDLLHNKTAYDFCHVCEPVILEVMGL